MNKKLDTNFTYTILAVLTVGFLLWHSIAIFNLEQDLKALQSTSNVTSAKAQIQKDNINDDREVSTEILYNEDGSIDTSNWQTYTNEEHGFRVKYPEGWGVTNFNAFSSGLSLGPVDCNQTPDKCLVKSFSFQNQQRVDNKRPVIILNVVDKEVDGSQNQKNSTWHPQGGLTTGCEIGILIPGEKQNDYILSTFYFDIQDEYYNKKIKLMCEENNLDATFGAIVQEFTSI